MHMVLCSQSAFYSHKREDQYNVAGVNNRFIRQKRLSVGADQSVNTNNRLDRACIYVTIVLKIQIARTKVYTQQGDEMPDDSHPAGGNGPGAIGFNDDMTLRSLEMERWLPQTTQAMRKLRVPGRGDPERYAILLQALAEKGELSGA